jgi:peroxiredoxin
MPEKYMEVGTELKDFTLLNDKGFEVSPTDFRGTYLFVDFWATWCAPCREEFPALKLIYNQYEDKGFNMLAVSIDDEKEKWLHVVNKDKFRWNNVFSKGGVEDEIVKKFNLYSIPTNYLLDENGIIIAKDINPEELDAFLKKHISKG